MKSCTAPILALTFAMAAMPALGTVVIYRTNLDGPTEAPPNSSPGTGTSILTYDSAAHTYTIEVQFSGLIGNVTVAHIHCCTATPFTGTAGVATPVPSFPSFPAGGTSGSYSRTFDLTLASSWNPAFITANGGTTASAEAAFTAGLASGRAYLNIHSSSFGGGEIRGFYIPEPSTYAMAGIGLIAFAALRRRRA